MARYSIEDTTLTALGDAIRNKIGETEYRDVSYTSMSYFIDGSIHNSMNTYAKIPVGGATTIQLRRTGGEGSAFLICDNCYSTDGIVVSAANELIILDDFTADYCGFHTTDSSLTYEAEVTWYDADGNQMDVIISEEVTKTMTPERMATEINNLDALDPSLFNIKNTLQYRFYGGSWDKFIELYGDKVVTSNIFSMISAFQNSSVKTIGFDINGSTNTDCSLSNAFQGCSSLIEVPMIRHIRVTDLNQAFQTCHRIRYFPEGFGEDWDWSAQTNTTSAYTGQKSGMFTNCYSLRELPMILFKYGNPNLNYSYHPLRDFNNLYCLDEVVNMPYPHNTACKSTGYSGLFYNFGTQGLSRLKNFTFAEDIGTKQWANQVLDLSYCVGYHWAGANYKSQITGYNSGITDETLIKDDETYQLYKDHPDSWTQMKEYSRYNHDSAVATINSLPDCSEYATANGTNTIMFSGSAGSLTDGGAINTLTNEEIAVAAAKGWTVTF